MNPKIVGYGICGPNEPYLRATLDEFERLCDEVIICFNNATPEDKFIVKEYGFHTTEDNSEWGKLQWKIKEDFVTNHVAKLRPDLCVCLDMDEVFDKNLTKEKLRDLYKSEFQAFYFYIINLWDNGYQKERSFWNIRAWKWSDELGTKWPRKSLHCGLAPEWTWVRAFYSPYILKHYGLKDAQRRLQKASRYDKYDPEAKFIAKEYYDSLRSSPQVDEFDEDKLHQEVVEYVKEIKQKYIMPMKDKEEIVYIRIPSGEIVQIPKSKAGDYIGREGHDLVEEPETFESTLNELLDEDEEVKDDAPTVEELEKETIQPEPSIEFTCSECDYMAVNARALMGHKMGKHDRPRQQREAKKNESKSKWSWTR